MSNPYRSERIATWVSDFCDTQAYMHQPPLAREYAPQVLGVFLEHACARRDVEPDEIEESDLKPALLEGVAPLTLPASARAAMPELCAVFLEELETQGRLGGGRTLGLYVRALKGVFVDAASGTTRTLEAPGSKLGRNDPCPCGSGRKYKKCCMNLLGG